MDYKLLKNLTEAAKDPGLAGTERTAFLKKMKALAKKVALPELKKAKAGKIETRDGGDSLDFEFDVRKKFGEYPEPHPDRDSLGAEEVRRFPFAQRAVEKTKEAFTKELGQKPKKKPGVFGFANTIWQYDQVQVVLNGRSSPGNERHDVGMEIVFKPAGRKIF